MDIHTSPLVVSPNLFDESSQTVVNQPVSSPTHSQDQADLEAYISNHAYAAEPTYFTRPNRFLGPAATWRSWTANDRAISDALDMEGARDLSAHLCNAFMLKKADRIAQFRDEQRPSTSRSRSRSRSRSIVAGKRAASADQTDTGFKVPDIWTAWPVPLNELDEDEGIVLSRPVSGTRPGLRSSARLDEALLAVTLRHARRQWDARGQDVHKPESKPLAQRDWKTERLVTDGMNDISTKPAQEEEDTDYNSAHSPSPPRSTDGGNYFSSQGATLAVDFGSDDDENMDRASTEEPEPVFLVDDDVARTLLQPGIQNIRTQLDELLIGLHKQRNAYAAVGDGEYLSSRDVTDAELTTGEDDSRTNSRGDSRGRKRVRRTSVANDNSSTTGEQVQDSSTSRSRSRYRHKDGTYKIENLGLRDWSDVLGMAALTGFDAQVVGLAAEKCARIFGENMLFRTFREGNRLEASKPEFDEAVALLADDRVVLDNTPAPTEVTGVGAEPDLVLQRTSKSCMHCIKHKLRCEPVRSISALPVDIKLEQSELQVCAACAQNASTREKCSGITVKLAPRPVPKSIPVCPHTDCPRHTEPFAKQYQLARHIDTMHAGQSIQPKMSLPVRPPPDQHIAINLLSCPIATCPQRRHVYTRPAAVLAHIRNNHSEIDADEHKRTLAQYMGNRTGRATGGEKRKVAARVSYKGNQHKKLSSDNIRSRLGMLEQESSLEQGDSSSPEKIDHSD